MTKIFLPIISCVAALIFNICIASAVGQPPAFQANLVMAVYNNNQYYLVPYVVLYDPDTITYNSHVVEITYPDSITTQTISYSNLLNIYDGDVRQGIFRTSFPTPADQFQSGQYKFKATDREGNTVYAYQTFGPDLLTSVPIIESPLQGETATDTTPTISWTPVTGASLYRVEIWIPSDNDMDRSNDMNRRILKKDLVETNFKVPEGILLSGCRYEFWIIAFRDGNLGSGSNNYSVSEIRSFYTPGQTNNYQIDTTTGYLEHRVYPEYSCYRVRFSLQTAAGDYPTQDVLSTAKFYGPDGNLVPISHTKFWDIIELKGNYDEQKREWKYENEFKYRSYYSNHIQSELTPGPYRLEATDAWGNTSSRNYSFSGLVTLPILPINSIQYTWKENGDLNTWWDASLVPNDIDTMTMFMMSSVDDVAEVRVMPTDLGKAFIPAYIVQMFREGFGETVEFSIELRTVDQSNHTRYLFSDWLKNIQIPVFDSDGDGIFNVVDVGDNIFSDGVTSGTIQNRGNQSLVITDATNPSSGVLLAAYGGTEPVIVSVCDGSAQLSLNESDVIEVTCGSAIVNVISGTVEVVFTSTDGSKATTNLIAGNTLVFDSSIFTITAPPSNSNTVIIVIDGKEVYLEPGESNKYAINIDIKPGDSNNCFNQNDHGVFPVVIFGSANFNVSDIDIETLSLQGLAVKMAGKSNKYLAHTDYVNSDEFLDVTVQFEDSDGWISFGSDYALLTGKLLDERFIEGKDTICIVP